MTKFLYVHYGKSDTNWDVSFSDDQLAAAGVDEDLLHQISVAVDPDTGATRLNVTHGPGTAEGVAAQALFDEFEPEIRQALVDAVLHPNWIYNDKYDAIRDTVPPRPGL